MAGSAVRPARPGCGPAVLRGQEGRAMARPLGSRVSVRCHPSSGPTAGVALPSQDTAGRGQRGPWEPLGWLQRASYRNKVRFSRRRSRDARTLLSWCSTRGWARTGQAGEGGAGRPRRALRRSSQRSRREAGPTRTRAGSGGHEGGSRGPGQQVRGQPDPARAGPPRGPYLVAAGQEEVHRGPVDAVPLAEPRQDLLDGQPRPDEHHAGRPVGELDAAVLGGLVPLGSQGPAGL